MINKPDLIRDRKGSVDLIQLVLALPIFILIFYGFFEVWKIVSVRQSLGAATYHAARCRSLYPGRPIGGGTSLDEDGYRCEWGLLKELVNNSFVEEEDLWGVQIRYRNKNGNVICVVTPGQIAQDAVNVCPNGPTSLACNEKFDAEAALFLPWSISVPGLPSRGMTLVARHRSFIECDPNWQPTPLPILTPTVPPP